MTKLWNEDTDELDSEERVVNFFVYISGESPQ